MPPRPNLNKATPTHPMPSPSTPVMRTIASFALAFALTTNSYPVYFPPAIFTNTTSIDSSIIPTLVDPNAALAWNQDSSSPSILVCSAAGFAGKCVLIENNAKDVCLGLNGVELVGSLKVGGGGGCVVFG